MSCWREPQRHPLCRQGHAKRGWVTAGRLGGGWLFLFLLSQIDEFLCGETAQDGENGQQRGPVKGQGLLVAPLQVALRWQKSPEGSVQEFYSFQTRELHAVGLICHSTESALLHSHGQSSEGKLRHRSA